MKLFKYHKKLIGNGMRLKIVLSTPKFMLHFSTFERNQELIPFDQPRVILQKNNSNKSDKNPLIAKLETFVNANLHNEQFGVEQLAEMMGMSRSHLHRKLQKIKGKSISRFIREYRLRVAREMLIEKEMTAAEVSHAVGFGSPSYFNKCFTEYFGYSPGKARLKVGQEISRNTKSKSSKNKIFLWLSSVAAIALVAFLIFYQNKKEVVVAETAPKEISITVLPFKNLSSDEENQYLADGMVDAISRNLSNIESLNIINSSAIGPLKSVKEIRETLNISTVLQGSIQRQDSIIRVEVKLLDTSDESQIWAEHYDRKLIDILKINSDIAQNVAKALNTTITSEEKSIIENRSLYNPIAYDYSMQGLYHFEQLTPEGQVQALRFFEKALEIDSTLAPAYHGIAGIYLWKASSFGSEMEAYEAVEKARFYIKKTRQYDANMLESLGQEAYISLYIDWDFEKAERLFLSCIDKSIPIYHAIYINLLMHENRHKEAYEHSIEFTVKHPFYHNSAVSVISFFTGDYERGKEFIESRANTSTISLFNLGTFGFFYLNYGEYDKAISWFEKEEKIYGVRLPRTISLMGAAYARKGNTQKALELQGELKELKSKTNGGAPAFGIAIIYSALGKKQEALKWLKISVENRESEVLRLVSDPQLYSLHGMPEFDALVKQVGFRERAYPVELPAHFQ
ncbi:helix-turn-helix domain-containing protein [Aggregatimonas sangjinii]|uniref:Helix-turn-helix domain-containing protein n=1 Tax=Aggregatimonas sangjinii TaxID=2583587 RepID=A0A5B7SY65_9FLAO|nr:helix-turn-helix domain-containing protein [Aggregatimonas sangjinii]QCX01704.1 helix-turn-helix domain-containing protein [Aggregatimonas sangjinii]